MQNNQTSIKRNKTPLVSVIVVTYNQEKTVIGSLNSVLNQTYENIELIVTDDCSEDQTIQIIQKWIDHNKGRFFEVKRVLAEQNTGVSGNCNRGILASKGDYIKLIGGDDRLQPFYVEKMVEGIDDCEIAFCYEYIFHDDSDLEKPHELLSVMPDNLDHFRLSNRKLYRRQLVKNEFNAPSALIKRSVFDEIGFFDERYPMMEDLPFWLKCVETKRKIKFVEIYGVFYRRAEDSISLQVSAYANGNETEAQKRFRSDFDSFLQIRKKKMYRALMFKRIRNLFGDQIYTDQIQKWHNRPLIRKVFAVFCIWLSPSAYLHKRTARVTSRLLRKKEKIASDYHKKVEFLESKGIYNDSKLFLARKHNLSLKFDKLSKEEKREKKKLKRDYRFIRKISARVIKSNSFSFWLRWHRFIEKIVIKFKSNGILEKSIKILLLASPIAIIDKVRTPKAKQKAIVIENEYNLYRRFVFDTSLNGLNIEKGKKLIYFLKEMNHQAEYPKKVKMNDKIRVVFLCYIGACFSSFESIYNAMKQNDVLEPFLLVTPYMGVGTKTHTYDDSLIKYLDNEGYEYDLAFVKGQWKSIFEYTPNAVFYQTPYWEQLPVIYNYNYRNAFPKLLYTPYGPWIMDRSVEDFITCGLAPCFFDKCWRAFFDKFSWDIMEYAAPQYKVKSVLSGSPKVDFCRQTNLGRNYCWKSDDAKKPKIIWMPRWNILKAKTSFPDYYEFFMQFVKNGAVNFVFRPHPLLFNDIIKSEFLTQEQLDEVKDAFKHSGNSNLDTAADYRPGLLSCDFLIMDFSSIIYEYLPLGKPVIYTKKDNALVDQRIMDACYVVESCAELEVTIAMLISGKDPLKAQRLKSVEDMQYFPHEKANNAEYIAEYIADNILD